MKNKTFGRLCMVFVVISVLLISGNTATAQEILLDKMEKCGDLICYPGMKEPNQFYYLPDQPRLAYKDGKPQFSFLKYARTQETGKAGIGQAQGGGILHFLVTYGASNARVKEAEKKLREKHPDATIAGPIVYRKGNFALITSFKEGNALTTHTVAVGKAPLMEGQKAAVSMALTREGAELLWESFKSDTPDISLVFDMEFVGIREPYEATLEADWSNVAKHDRIKAGFKYKWFGADVDILFQELRQTGAIKITTKGEDVTMDNILQSANAKLLSVMFDPAPDELTRMAAEKGSYDNLNQAIKMLKDDATPSDKKTDTQKTNKSELTPFPGTNPHVNPVLLAIQQLAQGPAVAHAAQQTSSQAWREPYDKGKELLYRKNKPLEAFESFKRALELVGTDNRDSQGRIRYEMGECLRITGRCDEAVKYYQDAIGLLDPNQKEPWIVNTTIRLAECHEKLELYIETLASYRSCATLAGEKETDEDMNKFCLNQVKAFSPKAYNEARRLDDQARASGYESDPTGKALAAYQSYLENAKPSGQRATEVEGRIRYLKLKAEEKTGAGDTSASVQSEQVPTAGAASGAKDSGTSEKTTPEQTPTDQAATVLTDKPAKLPSTTDKDAAEKKKKEEEKKKASAVQSRKGGSPGFSLVASYQMKQVKRSGRMVYQMNHYRTETQAFAMAENIGSIYKRYGNDSRIFRAVTIDDPVFKQREILVTLDGQDAETFTKYLNFVTVKMKKRHQAGEVTTGEIVITPETFNASGNNFSMIYGWKDDINRTAWLNYEYQAIWSFHGGVEIRTPWTETDSSMLALAPPHRYRTVSIEGNGDFLSKAEVRHGVVTLSCRIGDRYIPQQVTIRNNGPAPSMMLDIPEDPDNPDTQVGITWYLTKSRKLSSAETKLEGDIIYWDELPKGGI